MEDQQRNSNICLIGIAGKNGRNDEAIFEAII